MSSAFDILTNYGSDSFTPKIKQIRREIIKERTKNLNLESESLRSEGRNSHAVVRFDDERLKFAMTLPSNSSSSVWELPSLPDGQYLKLWYLLDHLGTQITDISGFNNHGILEGHPTLTRSSLNMGTLQTSASPGYPAIVFNSILEEEPDFDPDNNDFDPNDIVGTVDGACIIIPDNPDLQFTNHNKKFSISFRFHSFSWELDPTNGGVTFRRFATKKDDESNGWLIAFDDDGDVVFHVFDGGVWYRRKVDDLSLNTWYEVFVTYDSTAGATAADRIKIYIDGVESSVDDSLSSFILSDTGEFDFYIGCRQGEVSKVGFFRGYIQDFKCWMDKVITSTEVSNHFTNKWTIDNIALGNVPIINYFTIDPE